MTITDPQAAESVEAVDEEPTPDRGRRKKRLALTIGVSAAVVAGGWVVLGSPLLSVNSVEVTGYSGPTDQIVQAAGIAQGSSLLLLNPTRAAEQVSSLETIATATVSRQWPNGVVIDVVPERAVAYLTVAGGYQILGGTGGQLEMVGEPPADLPQVEAMTPEQITDALNLIETLPPETLGSVQAITFDTDSGYTLTLRDGRGTVVWGQPQEAQLKATVLAAMMRVDDTARWFDLTNPRAPRASTDSPTSPTGQASGSPVVDGAVEPGEPGTTETPEDGNLDGTDANGTMQQQRERSAGGEQSVGLRPAG